MSSQPGSGYPIYRSRAFQSPSGSPTPSVSPRTSAYLESAGATSPLDRGSPTASDAGADLENENLDPEATAHPDYITKIFKKAAAFYSLDISPFVTQSVLFAPMTESYSQEEYPKIFGTSEGFDEYCLRKALDLGVELLTKEIEGEKSEGAGPYVKKVC